MQMFIYSSKVQETLVQSVLFVIYLQFLRNIIYYNNIFVFQVYLVFLLSPLQLEAVSRKEQSIDMEGAQQAIQLVPYIWQHL